MSDFQKLLGDLEALSVAGSNEGDTVAKSMPADDADAGADDGEGADGGDADDAAIAAAAADGEAAGEGADDGAADGDDAPLGKSMTIVGEDGETVEAIDATDLIKSLVERVESSESDMGKAVGLLTDLVKSQAAEIGKLTTKVGALAGAGRGRRAVVNIADRPALAKSLGTDGEGEGDAPEGITANEFMAKAMDACTAGKITGLEVAQCESYINRGLDVPANIKTKVFG